MATHKINADIDVNGEVQGTSLDINGNGDISGSLTLSQYIVHSGDADTFFGFSDANVFKIHVGNEDVIRVNGGATADEGAVSILCGGGTNAANIGLLLNGQTNGETLKVKINNPNTSGTLTGAGILSYEPDGDTFNIGQSTTHNNMAISIDNSENVTFKGDITCGDDLFMPSAGVINFNSGDVTITHSSNTLTVAGGNLAATISTAAQANITSLGTLSSLTVSGNITANGNIVGDDSTNITNIATIAADSYGADADVSTRIDMSSTEILCLVQDTDVFQATETDFVFDAGVKTSIRKRKLAQTTNTDGNADGDIVYFGSTTSMDTGKIYYYTASGTWALTDADAVATADGLIGVALGSASNTNGVLIKGMVTLDHDPGTVGDPIYLSTTAGTASSTAPSGSGDIVRVVGYCLNSSNGQIYFNPSGTFVEVA